MSRFLATNPRDKTPNCRLDTSRIDLAARTGHLGARTGNVCLLGHIPAPILANTSLWSYAVDGLAIACG